MDLNTALMESITSMSEYFVVANTRTSFTDMAESSSVANINPSSTSSPLNHHHHNLNQQFSNNNSNVLNNNTINNGNNKSLFGSHHILAGQSHLQQHTNNGNSTTLSSMHSSSPNQTNFNHNHSYNSNQNNVSNNLQSSSRLSQPVRTQIPIHCYIEQLDACADMPGYNSPLLNDNDLFNTTNNPSSNIKTTLQTSNNNNHSNGQQSHQQLGHNSTQHLHQSKLALESVTNCNGGTTNLSSLTNSSSVFNENETNNTDNNNDIDNIDSLDHLNPNSPLSVHQHSNSTQPPASTISTTLNNNHSASSNSICGSSGNRFSQASSSYDNHHFQSCRETYAIVTSNVLYIDLVRTVLLQLGYSAMDLINAKATIQIKNWRPLALDQVTEDKRATVGEVLGDISTFVTLRIRLYSSVTQLPTEWTETMIRQVVLALTQTMSQLTLSKLCNISQPLISSIVRGGKKLGRRKCAEFGQWYMNYIKSSDARPSTMFCEGGGARLVFDKTREIPQLKAWFANNTKPSDELLEEYSKILNEHALRKDRPQVTGKALKNWWKNERQKLGIRQREIRGRPKLKRID